MVAQRAAIRTHRRAGPAVEIQFHDARARGIREEAERLHGWPEQRDDWCAHARGHVHHTGVAGDEHGCPREAGAGLLKGEFSRCIRDRRPESAYQLAIIGATDRHQCIAHALQSLDQRLPVPNRPPLGGVRGARGESGDGFAFEPALSEPPRDALARCGRQKKLRRPSVRLDVEGTHGFEVTLGNRDMSAVDVDLCRDQCRASEFPLGIPRPTAPDQPAQRRAAQTAVQIEPVAGADRP